MKTRFKRAVVKIGSNVLAGADSGLATAVMEALADQVAALHRAGMEIILVSSGAVASGRSIVGTDKKLDQVSARQLYSSVGQARLINRYYELFRLMGEVISVPEEMMAAGTSLASCGIAYALKYMDAAMKGGEKIGFGQDDARRIVMNTMKGALSLLEANGTMPQTEIDKVTTPGGYTFKGLTAMEEGGFSEAVLQGLLKSM